MESLDKEMDTLLTNFKLLYKNRKLLPNECIDIMNNICNELNNMNTILNKILNKKDDNTCNNIDNNIDIYDNIDDKTIT